MNSANIYATLALSGLISLLAGCDGDAQDKAALALDTSSSIATASSVASVNSNSSSTITIEDCSLYPGAPACYIIKDSECLLENCEPDYRVMDACGVSKLPKNLEASMIKAGASDCGPLPSSSESNGSSSSAEQCSNQLYTSACYAITPKECLLGDCATNYRVLNDCGIKNLSPTLSARYIKQGDYNCGPDSSSSSSSSTPSNLSACTLLDGRTYFTDTLEESGRGVNSVAMHHWSISFKKGELNLRQSDFGLIGTYSCQGDQVIATINHGSQEETTLAFSPDFSVLNFNPLGGDDLTYRYQKVTETAATACEDVQGHTYTSAALVDANDPNLENGATVVSFNADGNSATFGYGDIREKAYYECDLGVLHLHRDGDNANPIVIDVEAKGLAITLQDKYQTHLVRQQEQPEEPVFCTQQYDPVCAAFDTGLRCITAPCDTFVYKTYGNACSAGADKSEVLFRGECGDKEGQPVQEEPIICPAIYAPVCAKAKANIACVTAPCPSHEYKTYGNACAANGSKAMTSFDGTCESIKLQNTLSYEQTPVHLFGVASDTLNVDDLPSSSVTVIKASIKEDVLTVTLGYSGCAEQPIAYNVDAKTLLKSLPAQVNYSFSKQQEDLCLAYFESTYEYDLLPLRANFREQVESEAGLAILGLSVVYKR